jgi:hypothetical protein
MFAQARPPREIILKIAQYFKFQNDSLGGSSGRLISAGLAF